MPGKQPKGGGHQGAQGGEFKRVLAFRAPPPRRPPPPPTSLLLLPRRCLSQDDSDRSPPSRAVVAEMEYSEFLAFELHPGWDAPGQPSSLHNLAWLVANLLSSVFSSPAKFPRATLGLVRMRACTRACAHKHTPP